MYPSNIVTTFEYLTNFSAVIAASKLVGSTYINSIIAWKIVRNASTIIHNPIYKALNQTVAVSDNKIQVCKKLSHKNQCPEVVHFTSIC